MSSVTFGVYDPSGAFISASGIGIDHYIVFDWNKPVSADLDTGAALTDSAIASRNAGRIPLVSILPYADPRITKSPARLLPDIAAGKYDAVIRGLASALKSYNGPVYLRWGPSMDDPVGIGRYPWAVPPEKADSYIAAYHRFVDVFRTYSNSLTEKQFLWSPMWGMRSEAYWPGDSFADYVACSMYVWQQYVLDIYKQTDYSFANLFGQRYSRLSTYNKPITIAAMGFEKADDQASWVADMKASLDNFPLLSAAVWTNAKDIYPWEPGGPIPDWSIDPALWHNP